MHRLTQLWQKPLSRVVLAAMLLVTLLGVGALATLRNPARAAASNGCTLNSAQGNIQHVIYVQFDNVHFTRDNPNVPSDLEQMPNLLNFIEGNGVLLTNHHTPLIAHTANDIVTSLTGVYGDRQGIPVSNSFGFFKPNGSVGFASSFTYWTDKLSNGTFEMLNADGKNAPAPWVPYTRAGCNVGAVSTANIELENIGTDISTVFGANSPQAAEAKANPNQATADFIGIAVHCAKGNALCSAANTGRPDLLPDEPGGYTGYNALYGHKYVVPQINPGGPIKDLFGNVIKDPFTGDIGFPGFGGITPAQSLSYVAAMQEHNVPVTYAYISDAHENHTTGLPYGPGEAGYVAQLKSYDQAFGLFFARLAKDGINKSNTLFVFTADEGDHFVGGPASPAGCDGVNIPCTYSQIGEIDANMTGLLATQQGITTPFDIHFDSAPVVYITGNPARTDTVTRAFERATGPLTAKNIYTGNTDQLTQFMADPVELKLLHMITADPARTPTFTWFADPNYFFLTGAPNCNSPCTFLDSGFAWNHGDIFPDINTTWLGMVGPGVQRMGVNGSVWSDETDIRPTMMELLGLKDDYSHDGRVLFEVLKNSALPPAVRKQLQALISLAQAYKQINAPVASFAQTTLGISTTALESNSTNDSTYTQLENQLINMTTTRDAIAAQMIATLEAAEFGGSGNASVNVQVSSLIAQGNVLLAHAKSLAHQH